MCYQNGNDDALGLVLILTSTVGPFQHGPDMTNLFWILNRLRQIDGKPSCGIGTNSLIQSHLSIILYTTT